MLKRKLETKMGMSLSQFIGSWAQPKNVRVPFNCFNLFFATEIGKNCKFEVLNSKDKYKIPRKTFKQDI